MLREIGETILLEEGYRVIVAEDGFEALVHRTISLWHWIALGKRGSVR